MRENNLTSAIVLIVDDRPSILDFARLTLEAQGMAVLTASNLDAAVAICEQDDVHVVLLDYRLCPRGGEQAVQEVRTMNPLTQVILHGGYGEPREDSHPGVSEGPDSLLQWIEVGLATYRRNASTQASRQASGEDDTATILFVGDRDACPWLLSWLESAGCRVMISPDPSEALDHYIRERAQVVILPKNLTSDDTGNLVRRIRVLEPSVPFIALCEADVETRRRISDVMQPHAICDANDSDRVAEAIESALNTSWRMDRVRADQDLRGLLLAKFSDDVRNAILAIQGYAEILRDDSQPQVSRAVDGLSDAAGAALNLVQKYLDLARLDAPNMVVRRERVAIDQIVKDLTNNDKRDQRRPLTLATNVDMSDRSIYTDGEKLSAALSQLLDNFAKSSVSGRVELDIKEAPQAAEFILRSPGCEVSEPIPEPPNASEVGNSLTSDHPDDGLGLAIAQRLTDLLGGSLSIDHGTNGESIVRLSIPRETETPTDNEMLH